MSRRKRRMYRIRSKLRRRGYSIAAGCQWIVLPPAAPGERREEMDRGVDNNV